jgi:hypothetical protein
MKVLCVTLHVCFVLETVKGFRLSLVLAVYIKNNQVR